MGGIGRSIGGLGSKLSRCIVSRNRTGPDLHIVDLAHDTAAVVHILPYLTLTATDDKLGEGLSHQMVSSNGNLAVVSAVHIDDRLTAGLSHQNVVPAAIAIAVDVDIGITGVAVGGVVSAGADVTGTGSSTAHAVDAVTQTAAPAVLDNVGIGIVLTEEACHRQEVTVGLTGGGYLIPEAIGIRAVTLGGLCLLVDEGNGRLAQIELVHAVGILPGIEVQCAAFTALHALGGDGTFHDGVIGTGGVGSVLHIDDAVLFIQVFHVHTEVDQQLLLHRQRHLAEGIIVVTDIQTRGIAAVCQIVVLVAKRSRTRRGAGRITLGAKLCSHTAGAADGRLVIIDTALAAHALEGDVLAGGIGILLAVAVGVDHISLSLSLGGSLNGCIGVGVVLADFQRLYNGSHGAVNDEQRAAVIGLGSTVGEHHQIAGVLIPFQILHTVVGVAGPCIQGIHSFQILATGDIHAVVHTAGIGEAAHCAVADLHLAQIVALDHVVVVIVTGLPLSGGGAVHAVSDHHIHLAAGIAGHSAEGHAVDAGAGKLMTLGAAVLGKTVSLRISRIIQRIAEVLGGLTQQETVHAFGNIIHAHTGGGDSILVKGADEELLAGLLIFQRAVDHAVIVGKAAQMGAAVGTEATAAEAADGTDDLTGLQIHLGQQVGIREVHILHLIVHADTLQVAGTATAVDGIIVQKLAFQSHFPHFLLGCCFRNRNGAEGYEAQKHNEGQDPSHNLCGHAMCPRCVLSHQVHTSLKDRCLRRLVSPQHTTGKNSYTAYILPPPPFFVKMSILYARCNFRQKHSHFRKYLLYFATFWMLSQRSHLHFSFLHKLQAISLYNFTNRERAYPFGHALFTCFFVISRRMRSESSSAWRRTRRGWRCRWGRGRRCREADLLHPYRS